MAHSFTGIGSPITCEIIYDDNDVAKVLESVCGTRGNIGNICPNFTSSQSYHVSENVSEIKKRAIYGIGYNLKHGKRGRSIRISSETEMSEESATSSTLIHDNYGQERESSSDDTMQGNFDDEDHTESDSSIVNSETQNLESDSEPKKIVEKTMVVLRPMALNQDDSREGEELEVVEQEVDEEDVPELYSDAEDVGLEEGDEVDGTIVLTSADVTEHKPGDMGDVQSEFAALAYEEELKDEFVENDFGTELIEYESGYINQTNPYHIGEGDLKEPAHYSSTEKKPFVCEICHKAYSAKYTLKVHMRLHNGEYPYPCQYCEMAYTTGSQLENHMRSHYIGQVRCEVCKEMFKDKNELSIHMQEAGCIEHLRCKICDKILHNRSNLSRHVLLHGSDRPYTCMFCNRSFAIKASYIRHLGSHKSRKAHVCRTCGRGYNQKTELKIHIARCNPEEKPFRCRVCKTAYANKGQLHMHMKKHDPDNPHVCDVCHKSFSTSNSLRIHMYVHTGNYPLQCPMCDKGFSHKGTLRAHVRTHTGERPYSCKLCGRCFVQKPGLTVHMTLVHPDGVVL